MIDRITIEAIPARVTIAGGIARVTLRAEYHWSDATEPEVLSHLASLVPEVAGALALDEGASALRVPGSRVWPGAGPLEARALDWALTRATPHVVTLRVRADRLRVGDVDTVTSEARLDVVLDCPVDAVEELEALSSELTVVDVAIGGVP